MKTHTIVLAVTLGAGVGLAAYVTHKTPATAPAVSVDEQAETYAAADQMYWARKSTASLVLSYDKLACRKLYGENYMAQGADCILPTGCTSCTSHKGGSRHAVIHDNAWIRAPKPAGPDYAAMMRQEKLVFAMSMADQGATEAGRKAQDHSVRCSRLTWSADIQCAK